MIFWAIDAARADGFHLEIKRGWALDLADKDGASVPVASVQDFEEA